MFVHKKWMFSLSGKISYLKAIILVRFSYQDFEVLTGQGLYDNIHLIDFDHEKEKKTPMSFRLPVSWVLRGQFPLSSGLLPIFSGAMLKK